MTTNIDPAELEISPLDRILGEFLSRTDAGEEVPLEEFLETHAEFRDEVVAFLKADALARSLAGCRLASNETVNAARVDTAPPIADSSFHWQPTSDCPVNTMRMILSRNHGFSPVPIRFLSAPTASSVFWDRGRWARFTSPRIHVSAARSH